MHAYPQAPEVMLESDGSLRLLRRRQEPNEVWASEVGEPQAQARRADT